jgi:hypothetical protein
VSRRPRRRCRNCKRKVAGPLLFEQWCGDECRRETVAREYDLHLAKVEQERKARLDRERLTAEKAAARQQARDSRRHALRELQEAAQRRKCKRCGREFVAKMPRTFCGMICQMVANEEVAEAKAVYVSPELIAERAAICRARREAIVAAQNPLEKYEPAIRECSVWRS